MLNSRNGSRTASRRARSARSSRWRTPSSSSPPRPPASSPAPRSSPTAAGPRGNMQRRELILGLGSAALLPQRKADAQQGRIPAVAWIGFDYNTMVGLREALRELGYVEGKTIQLQYLSPERTGTDLAGL